MQLTLDARARNPYGFCWDGAVTWPHLFYLNIKWPLVCRNSARIRGRQQTTSKRTQWKQWLRKPRRSWMAEAQLSSAIWRWTRWMCWYKLVWRAICGRFHGRWALNQWPEQLLAGTWLKWLHGFKLQRRKKNYRILLQVLLFTSVISFHFFLFLFVFLANMAALRFHLFIWVRLFQLLRRPWWLHLLNLDLMRGQTMPSDMIFLSISLTLSFSFRSFFAWANAHKTGWIAWFSAGQYNGMRKKFQSYILINVKVRLYRSQLFELY